jgi:hypothetical protein
MTNDPGGADETRGTSHGRRAAIVVLAAVVAQAVLDREAYGALIIAAPDRSPDRTRAAA